MNRMSELAERNRTVMKDNAEKMLADTRHDYLRSPTALLVTCGVYLAVTVAMVALWVVAPTFGFVGPLVWIVAIIALRLAVRSQADLSDEALDERMRAERNAAYVNSYRLVSFVGLVVASVALLVVGAGDGQTLSLRYNTASAAFWATLSLVLGAPSLALAVQQSRREQR
jgi:multisubunit Na+/H+ antiporter MnhB subunit